jgi:hypothetical protein
MGLLFIIIDKVKDFIFAGRIRLAAIVVILAEQHLVCTPAPPTTTPWLVLLLLVVEKSLASIPIIATILPKRILLAVRILI